MAKKNEIIADFTNVDLNRGGRAARLPEGDYVATIDSLKRETSKAGNSMISAVFKVKGKNVYSHFVLNEDNWWKLARLLKAMGKKVKKAKVKLDLDSLMGEQVGVTLVDGEPYNNRIKSEIAEFIPVDEVEEPGEDEDEDDDDNDDEDVDDLELEDEDDL